MAIKSHFSPQRIGSLDLKHRVVMAPITRMHAKAPANAAHSLNAEYYRQRATEGGLIIAEGSQVTPTGQGYPATPGIYSDEQIEGWRQVTTAVEAQGGLIFLRLWHVGRISHSSFQPNGAQPVAPSAVAAKGDHFTAIWAQAPFQTPRALEVREIRGLVGAYRDAARNALEAGFDGVELHGTNGYLIEQFLQSRPNRRDDMYGGSIPNRTRLLQVVVSVLIDTTSALQNLAFVFLRSGRRMIAAKKILCLSTSAPSRLWQSLDLPIYILSSRVSKVGPGMTCRDGETGSSFARRGPEFLSPRMRTIQKPPRTRPPTASLTPLRSGGHSQRPPTSLKGSGSERRSIPGPIDLLRRWRGRIHQLPAPAPKFAN